jgi:hypothetical protein
MELSHIGDPPDTTHLTPQHHLPFSILPFIILHLNLLATMDSNIRKSAMPDLEIDYTGLTCHM